MISVIESLFKGKSREELEDIILSEDKRFNIEYSALLNGVDLGFEIADKYPTFIILRVNGDSKLVGYMEDWGKITHLYDGDQICEVIIENEKTRLQLELERFASDKNDKKIWDVAKHFPNLTKEDEKTLNKYSQDPITREVLLFAEEYNRREG